jgi:predicted nucleic acid-binding protein
MATSVDAQILIWGVKRQATSNRQQMIKRATAFFQKCREDNIRVIIPAQALAEYLVGFDDRTRYQSLAILQKAFIIAPLDGKAACIAAELQHNRDLIQGLQLEYGLTKQLIKADINILASSIANGASRLISEDGHMTAMAQGRILVEALPIGEYQPRLGGNDPIL